MNVKLDINNFRQNHPELAIRDLGNGEDARFVLKYRGINKWLRVRKLLIQLKSRWRDDVHNLESERQLAKYIGDYKRYHKISGMIEMLVDCRQQIRALCHSPRDVDFPSNPSDFGLICELPPNFPCRPHKRWFWRHDGFK